MYFKNYSIEFLMVCLDTEKKSYSFRVFFPKPENPHSTSNKPE
jgi:hypothetical protein